MSSSINIPKLVQLMIDAYDVGELRGFLQDYFSVRLDHIINPVGVSFVKVVRAVVDYFDWCGALVDLVREFQMDRPGKVDLFDLLVPTGTMSSSGSPLIPGPVSSTQVDISLDEAAFYFVIEPDRRLIPAPRERRHTNEAVYVRISVVGTSMPKKSVAQRALSLAYDRSGSMEGYKTDVARAAADYLFDIAHKTGAQVAVFTFDEFVDTIVPLQQIRDTASHKRALRQVNPRGMTDLFSAWKHVVKSLRALQGWDRQVVLITDGHMNYGMRDPNRFEQEVKIVWRTEKIATTCISMGDNWNINLLKRLALAGGGSIHFIDRQDQAEQALHQAFHAPIGVLAHNVQAELTPLESTQITEVNGSPTHLAAGQTALYTITPQLLTNVQEYLVLLLKFRSPAEGQEVKLLRCKIRYKSQISAQTHWTPEKVLHTFGETAERTRSSPIVHQGVLASAHTALCQHLFRQYLNAFLRGDLQTGRNLLKQAGKALKSMPKIPRGYQTSVHLKKRRLNDIERLDDQVSREYIKQKLTEELSHRDAVRDKLNWLLDKLVEHGRQVLHTQDPYAGFRWANDMINEYAPDLPISSERVERGDACFWQKLMAQYICREGRERLPIFGILAGASFGFERTHQGTREEIMELLSSYLEIRYQIRPPK